MQDYASEKFQLKNLDCASCAAKIERGLKNVNGISDAAVDFANLTLHVKADDIKRVIEAVRRIEPAIELIPRKSKINTADLPSFQTKYRPAKEFCILASALVFFGLHLLFENRFHT